LSKLFALERYGNKTSELRDSVFNFEFSNITSRIGANFSLIDENVRRKESKPLIDLINILKPVAKAYFVGLESADEERIVKLRVFVDSLATMSLAYTFIDPVGITAKDLLRLSPLSKVVQRIADGTEDRLGYVLRQARSAKKLKMTSLPTKLFHELDMMQDAFKGRVHIKKLLASLSKIFVSSFYLRAQKTKGVEQMNSGFRELVKLVGRKKAIEVLFALEITLRNSGYEVTVGGSKWLHRLNDVRRRSNTNQRSS